MGENSQNTDFTPLELSEIGELLPAYEIYHLIAKGGMGAVYMARQKSLERDVAIKILPYHLGKDANFRASFEAEAKSMAKLDHPNLISIYDFGQVDGLLYIIMEMVQGKSLYHSAYEKTIEPSEAARIVIGICAGLGNAHENNILHRDIKPANILLDQNASPKIGDFGLAQPAGDTKSGLSFGTPGYSAPEVIHNPTSVDQSTDIYSVGIILYELLTGHLPSSPYSPAASEVTCDTRYDHIIRKATHPTPALRYRDIKSMSNDLEKIMNTEPQKKPRLVAAESKSSSTAKTLLTAEPATNAPKLKTDHSSGGSKKIAPANTKSEPTNNNNTNPPIPLKVGSNAPLIRNIIIIIALLAAIYIAWEGYKVVSSKREAEQELADEDKAKRKKEAQEKRDLERKDREAAIVAQQNKQIKKPKGATPVILKPKIESPIETLDRLRSALFQGKRNEMPKSTIIEANRARFYISTPMTWHAAQQFCERHGGHLTVCQESADLKKFARKIKDDAFVWLGAGTAGNNEWRWIDGTPWKQDIRKTSKAAYVSVNETGILRPLSAQTTLPFYIEWMMDGSTPGNLIAQLQRCSDSIKSGTPEYPAGTTSYDNRYYLCVDRASDWQTARDFAATAGGVLGVPSNADENSWITIFLEDKLNRNEACWIGGFHPANSSWKWSTGEPWQFANWRAGAPDENTEKQLACAMTSSGKWDDYTSNATLRSFLIEWSKDGQGLETVKIDKLIEDNPIATVRAKCAALLIGIQKRYEKDFHNNIKGYEQELAIFQRNLVVSEQKKIQPLILKMKSLYNNGRIPKSNNIRGLPKELDKIFDSRLQRQTRIQSKYSNDIESIRRPYRANLARLSKELKSKGLASRVKYVEKELSDTDKETENFMNHILEN
jgi:serine/threonine protein kinase